MPLPSPTSLGLPAKPGAAVLAATAAAPAPVAADAAPEAESSAAASSRSNACAICSSEARYTCPRCSTRTCSLSCSKAHKAEAACSGVRDPAAFVPLKSYTQGTWDGDYAWLESTRRQVAEWGQGLSVDEVAAARGGAARGRGGGRGGGRAPAKRGRLDGLRWAVSEIGAEVDLLPDGMQRRKTNQSSWNPKTRALFLTVGLAYGGLAPDATHPRVAVLPTGATLASLLPESLDTEVVFALPYHVPRRRSDLASSKSRRAFFPPLDGAAALSTALKGTAFVEFPVVHVFAADTWAAAVTSGEVAVMPLLESTKRKAEADDGGSKRAKVDDAVPPAAAATAAGAAPAAITGLAGLGDYDSDDDSDGAADEAEGQVDAAAEDGTGDITLSPTMAAALGAALVADFGE
ncbi:Box C/D snoRNA accumulation [Vanrija albida]|uniref:Box C/D snoRNA accumulation n=1 Tax=Vanrija albida TaxID=181172 RepID=A0ABR3Q1C8_9TREE